MREISLTKGYKTIVDNKDFVYLIQWKWYASILGNKVYSVRKQRIGLRKYGKSKTVYMHREILKVDKDKYIDHKNGDGLDNRKSNLRVCTNQQNGFNSHGRPKLRKYSKFKGVKKNTNCLTWSARITFSGKAIYLGSFKTELEAAKAYNNKAKKLFGKFAKLNGV